MRVRDLMIGTGVWGGLFMMLVSIIILVSAILIRKKPGSVYFKIAGFWGISGIVILITFLLIS